jgi:hypothetical protein
MLGLAQPVRASVAAIAKSSGTNLATTMTAYFGQALVTVGAVNQTPSLSVAGATVRGRFERWIGGQRIFSQDVLAMSNSDGQAWLRTTVSWAAREQKVLFCLVSITNNGVASMLSANDKRCVEATPAR